MRFAIGIARKRNMAAAASGRFPARLDLECFLAWFPIIPRFGVSERKAERARWTLASLQHERRGQSEHQPLEEGRTEQSSNPTQSVPTSLLVLHPIDTHALEHAVAHPVHQPAAVSYTHLTLPTILLV